MRREALNFIDLIELTADVVVGISIRKTRVEYVSDNHFCCSTNSKVHKDCKRKNSFYRSSRIDGGKLLL